MLKDTDIYARVEAGDRTVTINTDASADAKAESIIEGIKHTGAAESFRELVEDTAQWLVAIDDYSGNDPMVTLVPISEASVGVHHTDIVVPDVMGSNCTVGITGAYEGVRHRYGPYMYTMQSDELPLSGDDINAARTSGRNDWEITNAAIADEFTAAAPDDIHDRSTVDCDWVTAYNRESASGTGAEYDHEVFIPVTDLTFETPQQHTGTPGIGVDLPSSARTAWEGPDDIGRYRMDATEIVRALPGEVPDE